MFPSLSLNFYFLKVLSRLFTARWTLFGDSEAIFTEKPGCLLNSGPTYTANSLQNDHNLAFKYVAFQNLLQVLETFLA
jgi:hypothetical protein